LNELELESTIIIQTLGYEFFDKPVIVGGLAMRIAQVISKTFQPRHCERSEAILQVIICQLL
jgi:hypothetical protein